VTAADVDLLMDFYAFGRRRRDFDQAIEMALARVLASPQFIYRIEEQMVGSRPVRLSHHDVDLASAPVVLPVELRRRRGTAEACCAGR
jgi:hypothetical protein